MSFYNFDQLLQADWSSQTAPLQPTQIKGHASGMGLTQMFNNVEGQRVQMEQMQAIQAPYDTAFPPTYTAGGPHLETPLLTPSPSPAKQLPQQHRRLQQQAAQLSTFWNMQDGKNSVPAFNIPSNTAAQTFGHGVQPQQNAQQPSHVSTSANLYALTVEERIALNEAWKEQQKQRKGTLKNSQQTQVQSQLLSPYATPQNTPQTDSAALPAQHTSFTPASPAPTYTSANGANGQTQGVHTPSKLGQPNPRKTPQTGHTSPHAKRVHNVASYVAPLASKGGSTMSPQMIRMHSALTNESPRTAQLSAYTDTISVQHAAGAAQQMPIDLTSEESNSMFANYRARSSGQAQAQPLNYQQVPHRKVQALPVNYQRGYLGHTQAVYGQKRSSADISGTQLQPYKRQTVTGANGSPREFSVQPVQRQPPVADVQAQFEKQRQAAQNMRQQREIAARKAMEARQVTQAQNIAKEQARQRQSKEKEKAIQLHLEAERAARKKTQAEKRTAAVQFKKDQQDAADFAEAVLKCKEEKLARERKLIRRQELRRDPSAIFRYYDEYMQLFPLDKDAKETRSQYHTRLLANRKVPYDTESDLALAIQYAHDNWNLFLEYPKQIEFAAGKQREKLARIAAGGIQEKEKR